MSQFSGTVPSVQLCCLVVPHNQVRWRQGREWWRHKGPMNWGVKICVAVSKNRWLCCSSSYFKESFPTFLFQPPFTLHFAYLSSLSELSSAGIKRQLLKNTLANYARFPWPVFFKAFWKTEMVSQIFPMVSQNTVEPLSITTAKIRLNFALWLSQYSGEIP